ncbi:PAS domain S-box protein, partial [Butyricicoccus sp. 1XD8-22]
ITYLNKAAQHLIKVKKRSFIGGKPVKEILHPSERENGIFQTSSKSLPSIHKFMNLEDEIIYAETSIATIREKGKKSTIVMLRDVTTKLRSEQALRESEERFRIIAENSKSIVKIITPKGKVTYCSSSIEEILGIPLWFQKLLNKSKLEPNIHFSLT